MITQPQRTNRRGAVLVLLCFLLVPLLALLAFAVDYGFLLYVRTDLQRSADQATLAAVRDLLPAANGSQDLDDVRQTLRAYAQMNLEQNFDVDNADIQIGRFSPGSVYQDLQLLNDGTLDSVRVTIRRDSVANSPVALYFARVFDRDEADVSATSTAILQPARYLEPGSAILPIALKENTWHHMDFGNTISVYGDGRIEDDAGQSVPGNWGTVDIGADSNSLSDLSDQIDHGLRQSDLNALHQQGSIPDPSYIDSQVPMTVNGDTGFSAGMKHAIARAHGSIKLIPFYRNSVGGGGNLRFKIVGWGAVTVVDSRFKGSKNSYVTVQKAYTYDSHLRPVDDLSDTSQAIEGVYTSPALIE